jgi:DNA-binding MarR family transcriptional regulator
MADASDDDAVRTAVLARDLRVVLGAMRRRLRAEGHLSDFTPSQLAVLSRLERDGPATVTSLAQAEGVRTQSMGATVSVLENSGFVQGAAHPTDGRQTLLSLTPAAREAFRAGRAAREDWLFRAIQANLSPSERVQLAAGIQLLNRVIEP